MPQSRDGHTMEPEGTPFDVVALVASWTGLEAVGAVLRTLPAGFGAAVLVALEADGGEADALDALQRAVALPIEWTGDGGGLRTGAILVCPPGAGVEVLRIVLDSPMPAIVLWTRDLLQLSTTIPTAN